MSFNEQKEYLISQYYGVSDFYSYNLRNQGWLSDDIIANCYYLQQAWAKEKISLSEGYGIMLDQIKEIKPEIVYLLDVSNSNSRNRKRNQKTL